MQEVVDDIQRCFDNCILYNGEDTPAGQRCLNVIDEFQKLWAQLNVDFYLKAIDPKTPLDEIE